MLGQEAQPGGAAHAAAGQAEPAELAGGVEGGPEAEERPEREGEEQAVVVAQADQVKDLAPAAEQVGPALGRGEPAEGPAGGDAGPLLHLAVAGDREGQVRAVGWVFFLVGE